MIVKVKPKSLEADITDTCFDGDVWVAFQKGFEAAQK